MILCSWKLQALDSNKSLSKSWSRWFGDDCLWSRHGDKESFSKHRAWISHSSILCSTQDHFHSLLTYPDIFLTALVLSLMPTHTQQTSKSFLPRMVQGPDVHLFQMIHGLDYIFISAHLKYFIWNVCLVLQSCPTLWNPRDCSRPGSSAYGIRQARILDWVAISFSRRSSQPRDRTEAFTLQADSLPFEPLKERPKKAKEGV